MRRRLARCAWRLLLACGLGCASAYRLSEQGLRIRGALTEATALDTVKRNVFPSAEQRGVCSAHTNAQFAPAEPLKIEDPWLVFNSYYETLAGTEVVGSVPAGTGQVRVSHRDVLGAFQIDLRHLHKIRVLTDVAGFGCRGPRGQELAGYVVMIDNAGMGSVSAGRPNGVMIHVAARNLDALLAALSFLSPDARMISGSGF